MTVLRDGGEGGGRHQGPYLYPLSPVYSHLFFFVGLVWFGFVWLSVKQMKVSNEQTWLKKRS